MPWSPKRLWLSASIGEQKERSELTCTIQADRLSGKDLVVSITCVYKPTSRAAGSSDLVVVGIILLENLDHHHGRELEADEESSSHGR